MADTITWIDADGTQYVLNGDVEGRHLMTGAEGRFMPPISFVEDQVPLLPGARLRRVVIGARDIGLPFLLKGETESQLRSRLRALMSVFDPSRGDGILRVTAPDSSTREIKCRYSDGLGLLESHEMGDGLLFQKWILVLRAFDPFWRDTADSTIVFTRPTTGPAQFIRPVSDVAVGDWQNELGESLEVYKSIDEITADDDDFAESLTPSSGAYTVKLADPQNPIAGDHVVRYRYRKSTDGGDITLNLAVALLENTTVIASNSHNDVGMTWTNGSFTLSGGEISAISDYSALRLRFTATLGA